MSKEKANPFEWNETIQKLAEVEPEHKTQYDNYFLRPEKPFLILFEINGVRDYCWAESEEEVKEIVDDYKDSRGSDFVINDLIEIGSCRELRIEDFEGD